MSKYRNLIFVILAISALLAFASTLFWRSPGYYTNYGTIEIAVPLLTSEKYDALVDTHPRPYIVEFETQNDGALLFYGSEHTQNPDDPQISDIQSHWDAFQPTVALVESRLGFFIQGLQNPVKEFGEMGWAFSLARKDNVPVYTWEIPREREIQYALEKYPKEQVALFYTLRPYFSNFRYGKPDDPDAVAWDYIRERSDYPGIENVISSVEQIDAIWQRDFPDEADWRDTSDQFGLPGYLGEIAARTNEARDEHFVRVIIDLVQKGERVFAIAGSSHAVKLEPALRATFPNSR
ncbi:MAG: hypothetical protein PVJ21_04655 [Anaerolineales bacterium]|jgi:hypothetical protein